MKHLLVNMALASVLGISACSTNTQGQNTGLGTVTGTAVGGLAASAIGGGTGQVVAIGVGALAGALIGGSIGRSMDNTDNSKAYAIVRTNSTQEKTHWINSQTGKTYTMTPTSDWFVFKNKKCRHFHFTATQYGQLQSYDGTACLLPNGNWQSLNPVFPRDQTSSWVNPQTGIAYTMTPTSDWFMLNSNTQCRKFHFTASRQYSRIRSFDSTACFLADNSWHILYR